MPHDYTLHLRRTRFLPQDGGGTVFCVLTFEGGVHGALAYLRPGQFPEFDGDEAWFRVRWWHKKRYEWLGQVANKRGDPLAALLTDNPTQMNNTDG